MRTAGPWATGTPAFAARALAQVFKGKEARKIYWAAVVGAPRADRGRIDLPLGKLLGPWATPAGSWKRSRNGTF